MGMKQNNTTNQGAKMKIKRVFAGMYEGTAQIKIDGKIEAVSFTIAKQEHNDYEPWLPVSSFNGKKLNDLESYKTMRDAKKAIQYGQWVMRDGYYCQEAN